MKTRRHAVIMLTAALSLTGLLDSATSASREPFTVSSKTTERTVEGDTNKAYPQAGDNSATLLINIKATAKYLVIAIWNTDNWKAYKRLIWLESRWNYRAYNSDTGAYGLGQLIGSRSYLKDKPYKQILKSLEYVYTRYGTPKKALQHLLREGWH